MMVLGSADVGQVLIYKLSQHTNTSHALLCSWYYRGQQLRHVALIFTLEFPTALSMSSIILKSVGILNLKCYY